VCGGCALQHASDDFIAAWRVDLIRRALGARGIEAPIRACQTSPPASRRRVLLAGRRTKKTVIVGFHGRSDDTLVPIETCAVADPRIIAGLPLFSALVTVLASRRGEARLAVTASESGLDIECQTGRPLDVDRQARLVAIAREHDVARLSLDGEPLITARPPFQKMGRARVVPPPGGFLQATPEGEAALVKAVIEALDAPRAVVDLFSGAGTFALPIAEAAAVHAVEAHAAALAALENGARGVPGLKPVTTEPRDLFRRPLRPDELARFDAAVIDPPRAGALAQAEALAGSSLSRIASVSCNSSTFARDARVLLDAGWRLQWVQPVDQFRWSPHLELVGCFSR
jgi:23S rRNA (uracil1939-C5)-methyltransferase